MYRACLVAAILMPGSQTLDEPRTLVLEGSGGFLVPVEINGAALTLRVDPAASGLVVLNPEAAKRARIEPDRLRPVTGFPGVRYRRAFARIGPVHLEGLAGTATASIGGAPVKLRTVWFDRDAVEDADGVISVHQLPYDSVRFALATPGEDETETVLDLAYEPSPGLYYRYALEGETVAVQVSVHKPLSVATAAAGAVIARHHAGSWAGADARSPVSFGISRPVRPMALGEPVRLEELAIERFLVRTRDHRGGFELPSDGPPDPEEIVVTAAVRGQPPRLTLVLGQEQLAGCSSLTYRRADKRLVARCAGGGR
ncbi:MAG: hypothetical protein ACK40O_08130 [Allosphingosinicella sp.]